MQYSLLRMAVLITSGIWAFLTIMGGIWAGYDGTEGILIAITISLLLFIALKAHSTAVLATTAIVVLVCASASFYGFAATGILGPSNVNKPALMIFSMLPVYESGLIYLSVALAAVAAKLAGIEAKPAEIPPQPQR